MHDMALLRTVLALLVVERVISKKKAEDAMTRAEKHFVRGMALPLPLESIIDVLMEDA